MASRSQPHSPGALRAIAVFKLAKGLLLVLVGLGALKLLRVDPGTWIPQLAERLGVMANARLVNGLLEKVLQVSPRKLEALGVGAFAYGALFLVEGVGLWLQKRWAEYLTIVSTAGFIPIEIYELTRRFDVERVLVLAINIAIVGYLIWRVRGERRESPGRMAAQPA